MKTASFSLEAVVGEGGGVRARGRERPLKRDSLFQAEAYRHTHDSRGLFDFFKGRLGERELEEMG